MLQEPFFPPFGSLSNNDRLPPSCYALSPCHCSGSRNSQPGDDLQQLPPGRRQGGKREYGQWSGAAQWIAAMHGQCHRLEGQCDKQRSQRRPDAAYRHGLPWGSAAVPMPHYPQGQGNRSYAC
jgi:hypothetical protein